MHITPLSNTSTLMWRALEVIHVCVMVGKHGEVRHRKQAENTERDEDEKNGGQHK